MQKSFIIQKLYKLGCQSLHALTWGAEAIIIASGLFMAIAVVVGVLFRYVFFFPIFGLDEFVVIIGMWFYFIGVGYSAYRGMYIKADVLPVFVKNKTVLRWLKIPSLVVCMTVVGFLFYWAFEYVWWAASYHPRTIILMIHTNYATVSLVIGSGLMLLYIMIQLKWEFRHPNPTSVSSRAIGKRS